jgi:hypothetical protein
MPASRHPDIKTPCPSSVPVACPIGSCSCPSAWTTRTPPPWPPRSPHPVPWWRAGRSVRPVGLSGPFVPSARASSLRSAGQGLRSVAARPEPSM